MLNNAIGLMDAVKAEKGKKTEKEKEYEKMLEGLKEKLDNLEFNTMQFENGILEYFEHNPNSIEVKGGCDIYAKKVEDPEGDTVSVEYGRNPVECPYLTEKKAKGGKSENAEKIEYLDKLLNIKIKMKTLNEEPFEWLELYDKDNKLVRGWKVPKGYKGDLDFGNYEDSCNTEHADYGSAVETEEGGVGFKYELPEDFVVDYNKTKEVAYSANRAAMNLLADKYADEDSATTYNIDVDGA